MIGMVSGLTARLTASGVETVQAGQQAYGLVYQMVIAQATTLAYVDTFRILMVGAGIMFLLSFSLRRNEPGGGAAAPMH
jgi:hypothetical protein